MVILTLMMILIKEEPNKSRPKINTRNISPLTQERHSAGADEELKSPDNPNGPWLKCWKICYGREIRYPHPLPYLPNTPKPHSEPRGEAPISPRVNSAPHTEDWGIRTCSQSVPNPYITGSASEVFITRVTTTFEIQQLTLREMYLKCLNICYAYCGTIYVHKPREIIYKSDTDLPSRIFW